MARTLHWFWPPLHRGKTQSISGLGDIQLIYNLGMEVQSELIQGPAVVIIQMDSGLAGFYFLW